MRGRFVRGERPFYNTDGLSPPICSRMPQRRPAGHRLGADLDQHIAAHAVEEERLRDPHRPAGGGDRLEARPGERPGVRAPAPPRWTAVAIPFEDCPW